jgi:ribonuclease P protein component
MPRKHTIEKLKTRPEYLRVAKENVRKAMPGVVVQYLAPKDGTGPVRVGLTVTARTGGAVDRNRIKRRLRAAINEILPVSGQPGATYIVIGRRATLTRSYEKLAEDLKTAVEALNKRAENKE